MPPYLQYSRQTFLHSQIPISNLFFVGLFCHVLLKRDQEDEVGDSDWMSLHMQQAVNTNMVFTEPKKSLYMQYWIQIWFWMIPHAIL